MGRQDVGLSMPLWAAEEEIRRLRQAQEAMIGHMAAFVAAARRGIWRELDALHDIAGFDDVAARCDYWAEFGALCAMAELAGKKTPDVHVTFSSRLNPSAKR